MDKDKFLSAINTMLHSWGSDTPQEVIWAFNEMMDAFDFNIEIQADLSNIEKAQQAFKEALQNEYP